MRILHVTDTHLGIDRWYRGAPPGWRRSDDHLAAFRHALGPALREEVDVVLHTGDLFDRSRPPERAVADGMALLAEAARIVPVVVLPGNHDRHGLRTHLGASVPGLHVVDDAEAHTIAGLRLAVVPYRHDPARWAADARAVTEGGADLLLAHQAFDGARVPGFVFRAGPDNDTIGPRHMPDVSTVLCGHIHTRQLVTLNDTSVIHPGSTERTAFVERAEAKGTVILEFGASVQWSFQDVPTRPMHLLAGEADIADVSAEGLVWIPAAMRRHDVEAEVFARGGWIAGPPPAGRSPQVPLFAGRAG